MPARIEATTAVVAPTRNGQPGVLRSFRTLATRGGPVASNSATRLIAVHHQAERYGSTRDT